MSLGSRRHDLDWVRILAFLLLILYHVGMYYVSWDFHVKSDQAGHAIEPLMLLTSPWRLSLLFLVSGVATAYLLERRPQGFLRSRSWRLLLPLAFGMLVIVPPQSYLEVVERLHYPGSYAEFYRLYLTGFHGFCRDGSCLKLPTWNHLWFVAYLWVYTLLLFAGVRLAPRALPALRHVAERNLSGLMVVLLPVALLVAARIGLAGRFPQTHALVDDWYNHVNFFLVFLLGVVLAGTQGPWTALERLRWPVLALSVFGWGLLCLLNGYYDSDEVMVGPAGMLAGRVLYGSLQWVAIAAVLGFARRHLNHDGPARRYLTAAIFPVYILHQTVIVIFAHALKPAHLYPPVEAVVLVLTCAAACFLGVEVIRRVGFLKPLFGYSDGAVRPAAPLPAPVPAHLAPAVWRPDLH